MGDAQDTTSLIRSKSPFGKLLPYGREIRSTASTLKSISSTETCTAPERIRKNSLDMHASHTLAIHFNMKQRNYCVLLYFASFLRNCMLVGTVIMYVDTA